MKVTKNYNYLPNCTCGAEGEWFHSKEGYWFVVCSNPDHHESSQGDKDKDIPYR